MQKDDKLLKAIIYLWKSVVSWNPNKLLYLNALNDWEKLKNITWPMNKVDGFDTATQKIETNIAIIFQV